MKRRNRGKAYFYAMGQRASEARQLFPLGGYPLWAVRAIERGYNDNEWGRIKKEARANAVSYENPVQLHVVVDLAWQARDDDLKWFIHDMHQCLATAIK